MSHIHGTLPRLAVGFAVGFVVLFVAAVGGARDTRAADDWLNEQYFPMNVGHKWVYAFDEEEVTFEVIAREVEPAARLYVVRRSIGTSSVEFKLAVEKHGVYIHREGEREFIPPLRQFAFFARSGDLWRWRGAVGDKKTVESFEHAGMEEVTVPAGTFTALRVERDNSETGDHATFWLAAEIGIVKLTGKSEHLADAAAAGEVVFDWQLTRFDPAR